MIDLSCYEEKSSAAVQTIDPDAVLAKKPGPMTQVSRLR